MEDLRQIGLFRTLSNIELAKLIPLAEIAVLPEGSTYGPANGANDTVSFILSGTGDIALDEELPPIPLAQLGPGDAYGQLHPLAPLPEGQLRARTTLKVARFRKEAFHSACRAMPALEQEAARLTGDQLAQTRAELARTKRMLSAYATELWYTHDQIVTGAMQSAPRETAAGASYPVPAESPVDSRAPRSYRPALRLSRRTVTGAALLTGLLGLYCWAFWSHPDKQTLVLALLVWGALNWLANIIPDYAVALAMVASAAAMGLAPLPTVLSGFTNSAYFLLLGIYGMGAAIQRTGLLYRFALFMLRKLPPTYGGQAFALALTGLLLTPILPSANGRVTIASPLVQELSEAMRLKQRSPGSGGLLLAALHGFGQMFFLFMSGGTCLVLWGLLPEPYRSEVTWVRWLWMALPLGIAVFLGFLAAVWWIPGARTAMAVSRNVLDTQLATLGPMSRPEKLTLCVTGTVFVLFATQPVHHVDAAWPAVLGVVLLLTTGIVDRAAFLQKIDWTYLAFFGAVVGYAELIRFVHLDERLGAVAKGLLAPLAGSPLLFLLAIAILTYLVRVAVPWSAVVPLVMLAVTPVVMQAGYHPFVAGVTMLAASNPFIIPSQNLLFLNAHSATGEKAIDLRMAARYGWVHAVVVLVGVLVSVPFWQAFGWTP